ncbi:hypothetical protein CABS03_07344 [Colletotrichum abscissum]|uniref:Uncharacterized protein n=1 Tax=Colletotrichum abscissum TaxID=1671311 RepID=A0A9P9X0C4_9PEZI|nr:hypothetical protein CABS02_14845 [Colletotrichum abscissum]
MASPEDALRVKPPANLNDAYDGMELNSIDTSTQRGTFISKNQSTESLLGQPQPGPTEFVHPGNASPCPKPRPQSRSFMPLLLVAGYAALSIFAWTTTCIMTFRPLWAQIPSNKYVKTRYPKRYVVDYNHTDSVGFTADVEDSINKNSDWYQGIQVLQSVLTVLTLPLTTTVIALADQGWSDAVAVLKAPWDKCNTVFLILAVVVYVIGGVLAPLQEYLLSAEATKVSYSIDRDVLVTDIPGQFRLKQKENNVLALITRGMLETVSSSQPQAMLWQGDGFNYTCSDASESEKMGGGRTSTKSCRTAPTLGDIPGLLDPFLAQFPAGYSTGLIRQFIPRISSVVNVLIMPTESFPTSCNSSQGSFWASYDGEGSVENSYPISVQICMPGNLTTSPWKPTRDMQRFTEDLYLNVTLEPADGPLHSVIKIEMETSAGYFELPNNWNIKAGKLLEKDPYGPGGACQAGCYNSVNISSSDKPHVEESDTYRQVTPIATFKASKC